MYRLRSDTVERGKLTRQRREQMPVGAKSLRRQGGMRCSSEDASEHVKNSEVSETLPYLHANKLACHNFMDAGRKCETPGSETKDFISHS